MSDIVWFNKIVYTVQELIGKCIEKITLGREVDTENEFERGIKTGLNPD